jgi:hypothetical protein
MSIKQISEAERSKQEVEKRVREDEYLYYCSPADQLVQALLENPTDVAYNLSAYYPKIIFRALDSLIRLAGAEGPLQKKSIEILLRISVNSDIDLRYREKARSAIRKI